MNQEDACGDRDPFDPKRRCYRIKGHAGLDQPTMENGWKGDQDFSAECQYFAAPPSYRMTKEKATRGLARKLTRSLADPRQRRAVSERFGLTPPEDIFTDEGRAEWIVDQIAALDLWTDVVQFRNSKSSGCSCDLFGSGRRFGAGGWHYLETESSYWFDKMVHDAMVLSGVGLAYRDKFVDGLGSDELERIESYAEDMAGTRVAYETCPRFMSAVAAGSGK